MGNHVMDVRGCLVVPLFIKLIETLSKRMSFLILWIIRCILMGIHSNIVLQQHCYEAPRQPTIYTQSPEQCLGTISLSPVLSLINKCRINSLKSRYLFDLSLDTIYSNLILANVYISSPQKISPWTNFLD